MLTPNSNYITFSEMYNSSKKDSKVELISNTKEQFNIVNFNNACHTPLLSVPFAAEINWHTYFSVCDGRGSNILEQNNDYLIEQTKDSIRHMLGVDQGCEVIFTYNATTALSLASELIFNYIKVNTRYANSDKNIFIHPLAHNSLRYAMAKQDNSQDVNIEPYANLKNYLKSDQVNIVGLPYIDNLIGAEHWVNYLSTIKTHQIYKDSSKRTRKEKFGWRPVHSESNCNDIPLYTILDACQAMTEIMFNVNRGANSKQFAKADAIAFSGHKMYSHHLGILVIKKKFLHPKINFNHQNLIAGGGSIEGYDGEKAIFKPNGESTIQGGLKNNASIFALGALLDSISLHTHKYRSHQNKKKAVVALFLEEILALSPIVNLTKTDTNHLPNHSIVNISSPYFLARDLYMFLGALDGSLIGSSVTKTSFMTRDGDCCVHYGCQKYKIDNSVRFSFSIANTTKEIVECIRQIKQFLAFYNLFDLENDVIKVPKQQI
jgi:selenocysteine lyase/cysteine desulfurase